ncbi:MAG: ATP-binding protein, partial [Anaeroplasmataceae bacterium]|nr:ATP-binding protein [Anaeroplasmataceae bacterium]
MPKFSFQISARLMNHLGEALISDELVALLELIKNSYDADANKSTITIDTNYENDYGQGKIIIVDDGSGMDLDTIQNSFLKLATDFKVKKQKISPKFKRLSLGNKGVGRLSLQRLGDFVHIVTNNGRKEYSFEIFWNKFNEDIDIHDVEIEVVENEIPVLNGSGTLMEIYGLKNIELWKSKDTFLNFKNEIIAMINPYASDESKFSIFFSLDEFRFVSDKYDVKLIESLADSIVDYRFDADEKRLYLNVERKKKYADYRLEEAIKRYNNLGFDCIKIDNQSAYLKLKDTYIIDLNNISKSYSKIDNSILIKNGNHNVYFPGGFEGRYFAFDKSPNRFSKENKEFLSIINGVKLFRNNFRILPYGKDNYEWLDFTKYSQRVAANIYRLHSVAGYVYINGEENLSKLRELTNRQGLLEDNYGNNFFIILRDIITRIIVDSDVAFRNLFVANSEDIKNAKVGDEVSILEGKIVFKKREDYIQQIQKNTENLFETVTPDIFDSAEVSTLKNSVNNLASSIRRDAALIQENVEAEKNRIEEEEKILDKYKIIMANSIVAESLAHEILKIAQKTKNSALNIRKEIMKSNNNFAIINANVDMIISSMQFLYRNASILDSNSYIKRNNFE